MVFVSLVLFVKNLEMPCVDLNALNTEKLSKYMGNDNDHCYCYAVNSVFGRGKIPDVASKLTFVNYIPFSIKFKDKMDVTKHSFLQVHKEPQAGMFAAKKALKMLASQLSTTFAVIRTGKNIG